MAFTEGFISELVGRKATVNEIPIGRVSDFLVNKPDDVFPRIDGLVIKTSQGLRFAPIESVATIDADGRPDRPDDDAQRAGSARARGAVS